MRAGVDETERFGGVGVAAPADLAWRVIHTKSRQEKALAEHLSAGGIEHFLPLTREVRYYGRRKFVVSLPLFPGYLFLRGRIDDWYAADRSGRVARVIEVSDQAKIEHELANLRLAIDRDAPLAVASWVAAGVRVQVASGPFRGVHGVIESAVRDDRLLLQVDMLGRAVQLEIDRSLLQPVE